MNCKSIFLISSIFLLLSCSQRKSVAQHEEIVKEFYKEQGLDKRTTYADVNISGSKSNLILSGTIQGSDVKSNFLHFLEEQGYQVEDRLDTLTYMDSGVARNSISNLRTEPRHGAELSSQYLMGQELGIIKQEGEWYFVQGPDRYMGWLDGGGLLFKKDISPNWHNTEKRKVLLNESVVYKNKNNKAEEVSDLVFGNILAWNPQGDLNVILPDGRVGYVDENIFESKLPSEDQIENAISRGYSLLGRPYLWGGTSTKAMDCSGFTRTCFYSADYLLGRDASLQVKEGQTISKENRGDWKRGDLLFFGNYREDKSMRITHVAIHLGDGKLIHSSERVRVESLNPDHEDYNSYRDSTLMAVRRIFE